MTSARTTGRSARSATTFSSLSMSAGSTLPSQRRRELDPARRPRGGLGRPRFDWVQDRRRRCLRRPTGHRGGAHPAEDRGAPRRPSQGWPTQAPVGQTARPTRSPHTRSASIRPPRPSPATRARNAKLAITFRCARPRGIHASASRPARPVIKNLVTREQLLRAPYAGIHARPSPAEPDAVDDGSRAIAQASNAWGDDVHGAHVDVGRTSAEGRTLAGAVPLAVAAAEDAGADLGRYNAVRFR